MPSNKTRKTTAQAMAQAKAYARRLFERARQQGGEPEEEAMREEAMRQGAMREEAMREEAMRQGAMREEAMREEAMREEAMREEAMREEAMREEAMRGEAMRQGAMREEAMPEEVLPEDALPEEVLPEEVLPEDALPEDALPEEAMPEDAMPEDAPQQGAPGKILGKFNNVAELTRAYQQLERHAGRSGSQIAQLRAQVEALSQAMQAMQAHAQLRQGVDAPADEEGTGDEGEAGEGALRAQLLADPVSTLRRLLDEQVAPMRSVYEREQKRAAFAKRARDFLDAYGDQVDEGIRMEMTQYMIDHNLKDAEDGFARAFDAVRARRYRPLEQLLCDSDVKEKILQDERIQNAIIQRYLQDVKRGNKAPQTIGAAPGARTDTVATPPARPKSLKDARSLAARLFGGRE
nr:pentapeptide MXKDX repeat protein [Maliibacterium massiliense]